MGKKGKKGKKGGKDKVARPTPITTLEMLHERSKMLCPRLGDSYTRAAGVGEILEEVAGKTLVKCASKKLETAKLSGLRLSAIPDVANIIPELTSLIHIDLSKNNLFNTEATFDLLSKIESLRKINLSENFMNGQLPDSVADLKNLEELRLDMNQLTSLSFKMNELTNLKVLTLSDNSISALPPELKGCTSLTYFNVRGNKISELKEFCTAWKNLERLYLGGNLFHAIPEDIGECENLLELDMNSNQITEIPQGGISNCFKLKLLHLGNNKITEIPPEILMTLTNLVDVQLFKNKITEVPSEIGSLVNLRRMSLASNNIKSLPEEIGACTSIVELYLNNNAKFSKLPATTGHLQQLKELSIRKCPALKEIPHTMAVDASGGPTSGCIALRELDVRAPKKQVCKMTPEMMDVFESLGCVVRGGVVKKGKKK